MCFPFRQRTYSIHAHPAFIACVQTMRARICSASSCAMFARVVWLKSWGAAKPPTFDLSRVARACHAWLARLTRARGRCFLRGRKALLNDFWYFWSRKSTINIKYLYVYFQVIVRINQYKTPISPTQTKLRLRGAEVLPLYFLICFSALSSLRLHRLPSAFPAP